ncbi:MAG: HAD-IA family hydrolase [Caldilineales bacterium]
MASTLALPTPFGVLWDLDGTIVDTGNFHYQSWEQALPEFGIPFSPEKFQRTFGMTNEGVLAVFTDGQADPALVEAVAERKEALFRDLLRGNVNALPGVMDWLTRLHDAGAAQALASSAPPANIDLMLDELTLRPYFAAVVSGTGLPSKPDPAVFLRAAERIGVAPSQCVVMEDALAGVGAAKNAGMRCIAVATTNPAEALRAADIVVERLDQLDAESFQRLLDGA